MKRFMFISILMLIVCCKSQSDYINQADNEDYKIIRLFIESHSKDRLFDNNQKFYLKKKLEKNLDEEFMGIYEDKVRRFKKTDSLCRAELSPIIDSIGKSIPCVFRDNYKKYLKILKRSDIEHFKNLEPNSKKGEIIEDSIKNNNVILVENFPKNNPATRNTVVLSGPFYNGNKTIALLPWNTSSFLFKYGSKNCLILKKVNDMWLPVVNLSFGS